MKIIIDDYRGSINGRRVESALITKVVDAINVTMEQLGESGTLVETIEIDFNFGNAHLPDYGEPGIKGNKAEIEIKTRHGYADCRTYCADKRSADEIALIILTSLKKAIRKYNDQRNKPDEDLDKLTGKLAEISSAI